MVMENLKYSEILQKNRRLSQDVRGQAFKVSVLANITVNSIKELLEYILRINQINPEIIIGNYDNIVQDTLVHRNSDLVIVFLDTIKIVDDITIFFEDISDNEFSSLKSKICSEIDIIFENLKDSPCVIFNTFSSNYFITSATQKSKIDLFTSELNNYLVEQKKSNVVLLDIDKVLVQNGIKNSLDFRLFNSSKAPYTLSFLKEYISAIEPIVLRNTGKLKKAIIFDCDNTIWKGIIGEDGIDGIQMSKHSFHGRIFNKVQQFGVFLSKRGVILGLCSKNNEIDVSAILDNHPDLVLKEEYIAIKKINWEDKVTNLRQIAFELNIGLDSIVFIDDSSFEVNLIKEQLPEVVTLQVPKNILEYPDFLLKYIYKYFNLSTNNEDTKKTEIYKQQFERENHRSKFKTIDEYLSSLNICLSVFIDELKFVPRIAQLTQKTNQFNFTTRRYTENQIDYFIRKNDSFVFAVSVKDNFGDNGLTALCIIHTDKKNLANAVIDTFLMSCRIIGRNIEFAFMDFIVDWLIEKQFLSLCAEFIRTKKNSQIENFYDSLGFGLINDDGYTKKYFIQLSDYKQRKINYIQLNISENGNN